MAYKDKDKQREAQREWVRQKRAVKGSTEQGSTSEPIPQGWEDEISNNLESTGNIEGVSNPKRGKDIKCFTDLPPDVQATIDRISESNEEKQKRTAAAIKYQHLFPNRYYSQSAGGVACGCEASVTGKPGDADYNGVCTDEWRKERGRGAAL